MTDRPGFVRTRAGTLGVIASEPDGPATGSLLLLHGAGGRRYGVNAVWAGTARQLAEEGWQTVRLDMPGRGESRDADPDRPWLPDLVAWMRARAGARRALVVGVCFGARHALAGASEAGADGMLLVSPYLKRAGGSATLRRLAKRVETPLHAPIDPGLREAAAAAARRMQVHVLAGAGDPWLSDAEALARSAPATLDVVPELVLHQFRTDAAQRLVRERILSWAKAAA